MASRPSFGAGAEDVSTFDFRLNDADQSDLLFDVQLPEQDESVFMPLYGAKTPKLPQRTLGEARPQTSQAQRHLYNSLGDTLFQRKGLSSLQPACDHLLMPSKTQRLSYRCQPLHLDILPRRI